MQQIEQTFRELLPVGDYCTLRLVDERSESVCVRQDVLQPVRTRSDVGAMVTVVEKDGMGYAATSDLSAAGLRRAADEALAWARRTAGRGVADYGAVPRSDARAEYASSVERSWNDIALNDRIELLREQCARLKTRDEIVDWISQVDHVQTDSLLLTSQGGRVRQQFQYLIPRLGVVANRGTETQQRTLAGQGLARQGGAELLDDSGFFTDAPRIAEEAVQLLDAPDCPTGTMDLILAPDQMILQIHESIGHPLELDRILGDERNYAGTSFVTMDMFGSYRYGSELLNITFDPTRRDELASYAYDDEGQEAKREYIIKDGILMRPLGGRTSQMRTGVEGVANGRACSWNRPPIDRMANLNLEPGNMGVDEMIAGIERGVFMATNCSWSIDDSRNKFQFGCEYGQLIENGKLTTPVKNSNYRGISASFWRNLKGVGDESTFRVMGTPNCGKGEPNQLVRVGHASPTCWFGGIEVFGGA